VIILGLVKRVIKVRMRGQFSEIIGTVQVQPVVAVSHSISQECVK
jgi:hypothetical protein